MDDRDEDDAKAGWPFTIGYWMTCMVLMFVFLLLSAHYDDLAGELAFLLGMGFDACMIAYLTVFPRKELK